MAVSMIFSRASIDRFVAFSWPAAPLLSTRAARKCATRFAGPGCAWDTSTSPMLKHTVRLGRIVVGLVLVLVGFVLALPLVPGPGVLVMALGVALLSHEFEWARRLRNWANARIWSRDV